MRMHSAVLVSALVCLTLAPGVVFGAGANLGKPISPADLLEIARSKALLAGRQAGCGRRPQALEEGLKRLHSGRDEQRRRVVRGDKGRAVQNQVLPALEML